MRVAWLYSDPPDIPTARAQLSAFHVALERGGLAKWDRGSVRRAQQLMVGIVAASGVESSPWLDVVTDSMARVQADDYRMIGDVSFDRRLNAWFVFVGDGKSHNDLTAQIKVQLNQYNSTGGLLSGVEVLSTHMMFRSGVTNLKYILYPIREKMARRIVVSSIKSFTPRGIAAYKAIHDDPVVQGVCSRMLSVINDSDLRRKARKRRCSDGSSTRKKPCVSVAPVAGTAVLAGKNRNGDIRAVVASGQFATCPTRECVETIVTSLGVPFNGFVQGRDPESPKSGCARFVFKSLGEDLPCPLCCVPHSLCNNNVLYVNWTAKSQRLYLKCFDKDAKENNWYQTLTR